ncbi:major facilitator transporter [Caballeronia temeraria]|uniref:Major facilitator transporter n=1 Tax=Caballeronia temeraria TaxID=1777137 RepID=A0A157ZZK3_9BURK|nr:MFS transporter [Caballeronia temeraria]SAK50317.1 major facilitator transporter [Caballeronia temeraria]
MTARQRWTILVASAGGALEVFDFVIYGFFARSIGAAFFPSGTGASGDMLSFAVLAIGYLSRPIGGFVFGRIGDIYGRRIAFLSSAMIAAGVTFLIGVLPSYRDWGIAASVLLVLLRLIQGLCLGGELPGAVVYAVETARTRPGFLCGVVFAAVNLALFLSTSVNLALQRSLTALQLDEYGWRLGFLIGGAVGFLSFAIRRRLAESDEYARMIGARQHVSLTGLFRCHGVQLLSGVGVCLLVGASSGVFIAYLPGYLQAVHYDHEQITHAQMQYFLVVALCILVTSHIGDRVPRRYVFRAGAALSALFTPWFFFAVTRHAVSLAALYVMAGVVASLANGTFACAIAEAFPLDVRFSCVATAMNLGLVVALGLTPLAAHVLEHGLRASPALVTEACAVLAFAASFGMTHRRRSASTIDENLPSPLSERS